jgi:hypothetical protein
MNPAMLGASHAHRPLPGCAFAEAGFAIVSKTNTSASRQAVPGGGDLWDGEEHRLEVGARERAS